MKPEHRRIVIGIAILVGLQAGAGLLYLSRGDQRAAPAPSFAHEQLSARPAPELSVVRRDGSRVALAELRGKTVLVHFWATWCPPCERELPGLLATAAALRGSAAFELLAISVDDDWDTLAAFFDRARRAIGADGAIPVAVVRPSEPTLAARYGAATLPDSYLVDPQGRLIARYAGQRDWASAAARRHLAQQAQISTSRPRPPPPR